jgi:chromosome partitioning protein
VKSIAIINQKGGVGKTTTAANLGAALALEGRRVLLLDLDSQSNLSMHLSGENGDALLAGERSSFELLIDKMPLAEGIRRLDSEDLWVLPGSQDLSGIEMAMAQTIGRELTLRDALAAYDSLCDSRPEFDYVLIDCPPSLGVLSLNALVAADYILIPLQTEFFSLQGMAQLMEVVQVVQKRLNPVLNVLGVLPCMVDSRTRLASEVISELEKHFETLLLKARIRKNIKLAEAPSFGQSIHLYAPESNGAADYRFLAKEVLSRLEAEIAPVDPQVDEPVPARIEPQASGEPPPDLEAEA